VQPDTANFQLLLFGFHCMIHRISIELRIGLGTAFIPDRHSLLIFDKFVRFFSNLDGHPGFWLPCELVHLCSPGAHSS
jgi:hypothetical protein